MYLLSFCMSVYEQMDNIIMLLFERLIAELRNMHFVFVFI